MKFGKISAYAAIVLAIGVGVTGCGDSISLPSATAPGTTNQEEAIDAAGVKTIDVQVPYADIAIVPSDDSQFHVVLKSNLTNKQLEEHYTFTSKKNGDKLEVGLEGKKGNFTIPNDQNIHLEVKVPKQTFDTVQIRAAKGDGRFESLDAKRLLVDTANGDIEVKGYKGSGLVANTKVGDIKLNGIDAETTKVDTASGDINVDGLTGKSFSVESASGDLNLNDIVARIDAKIVSGDVNVKMKELRENIDINLTAGQVKLVAPKSSAFSFDLDTRSGSLKNNFPGSNIILQDDRHLTGTVGSGGPNVRVITKSGDISVNAE